MARKPDTIRCDYGPECISGALRQWAENNDIKLDYIQPGNLQQNAYIERYNRTVRYITTSARIWRSAASHQCNG